MSRIYTVQFSGVAVTAQQDLFEIVAPSTVEKSDEYMQVVCMKSCRFYVRHSDGSALITPRDYELYI